MPTISLNKKRFLKLLGKEIGDERLSYYISMIGTDLERIDKEEIVVEVFPNRPDMLSEEGFARALRHFLGLEKEIKYYNVRENSDFYAIVDRKALKPRPYISGAVVKNVKDFNEEALKSIINLQEKLHITHGRKRRVASIGVHDLKSVEFPLKYVAVGKDFRFTPLGWEKEATIEEILTHHDKGKKYGHLLKDVYPIWVDNKGDVLALPPIINSSITEVTPNTKDFFIDVTGTNERVVNEILNIVVTHLVELGGEVYSFTIDSNKYPDLSYKKRKISLKYVNDLLGLDLKMEEIKDLLLKMGIGFEKINNASFYVLTPPYRVDILHPIDIVEDIGIAYGYERFEPLLPSISTIASLSKETKFEALLRDMFTGMKAQEVITHHLSNEKVLYDNMLLNHKNPIKVLHPMNEEYNVLRESILPLLLEYLSKNKMYEYEQFIFEIGRVFHNKEEETHLAWVYANNKAGYEDAKAFIDTLMRQLGISYEVEEYSAPYFIDGRAATIKIEGEETGYFGEIHPQVIKNFGLEVPIIGGELNVRKIFEKIEK